MANYYGLQKLEETPVRGTAEMISGTANTAGLGAQIGSTFGPVGTGIGAALGGAYGLTKQMSQRNRERYQLANDQNYNKFVDSMQDRTGDLSQRTGIQAKNGLVADGKNAVEIETREIHVDKNYNIKNIGTKKHSEGGNTIPTENVASGKNVIKDGDAIFPTQDPADFKNTLTMIRRYKINGDKNAKKQLDAMKDSLPKGDETPMAYNGNEWWSTPDGKSTDTESTNEWYGAPVAEQSPVANPSMDKIKAVNKFEANTYTKRNYVTPLAPAPTVQSPYEDASDIWNKNIKTNKYTIPKPRVESNLKSATPTSNIQTSNSISTKPVPYTPTTLEDPEEEVDENVIDEKVKTDVGAFTKYADVVNNFVQGFGKKEKVTQRYMNPEDLKYVDTSAEDRKGIKENRNAMLGQMRGKGLSAGQQQGYMGRVSSQTAGQLGQVNAQEAQRYMGVQQANTQQRNAAQQMNVELANRYETENAQNRAANQRYVDEGASELSRLGELNEQTRYIKSKDAKAYAMQEKYKGLAGSENWVWDDKLGTYIHKDTGERVNYADWEVKRKKAKETKKVVEKEEDSE